MYKSNDRPAYRIAAKNADIELRRAKLNFEKKLAQNIKKDTKSFYAYVGNKSKSKMKVGPIQGSREN